ncbi:MAG: hypothetical protein HZA15_02080 [Nitrospirae bacterium]|nr:hypothetical protein [Nitrospirota bacterium]
MIMRTRNSILQSVLLSLIFIIGLSSVSWGAEFWLRAETLTKTMPDTTDVTMWGFAQCTDATYLTCSPATVPGPRLTVPVGDTVLTINLRNNLTGPFVEPVSVVIPGQMIVPTPVRNPDGRVRSFTNEAPPDNTTTVIYTWNNIKPGTYLYESGTHPAVQVQMGLYGAVTRDAAAGQAYGPTTAYNTEAVLLFSEIDPVLHDAVATNNYGPGKAVTSTMNYEPKYFLINGDPYSSAAGDIPAGLPGQNVLLRFLSAGLRHRVPAINGLRMSVVAEDGSPYLYPKDQYSLLLPPGKTMDAIIMAAPGGRFPVYDRRLGLKNNDLPSGGMLRYLNVGGVILPTGSVVINSGAATTNSLDLTLTLSANAPVNAITGMQFSWDNITWLGWVAYDTTANITMPAGPDGTRTIYAQFRDSAGNVSATYMDTILLDRVLPTGSVVINNGAATTSSLAVSLTLSAADSANAVTNMQFSLDNITWLGWVAYAMTANITMPAGPDGTRTIYVQFRDAAGNVSLTYSDSIQYVTSLFTGSVLINSGAAATNVRPVVLTYSATSTAGAVTQRRQSWNNGATWSGWAAYTTTASSSIPVGADGVKTVSVQYRDSAGNVSATYTDSILLDRVLPTGSVMINSGAASTANRNVTLTFSATDAATSVTNMRWSWTNAAWGPWVAYTTPGSAVITGGAGTKTIRVQYRDAAGNVSTTYTDAILFQP